MKVLGTYAVVKPVNYADIEAPKDKNTGLGFSVSPKEDETEEPIKFEVVAVGRGRISNRGCVVPNEVEVGDIVILNARNDLLRKFWKENSFVLNKQVLTCFSAQSMEQESGMFLAVVGRAAT
jgi:co-chaperonin GroES (HSP10)